MSSWGGVIEQFMLCLAPYCSLRKGHEPMNRDETAWCLGMQREPAGIPVATDNVGSGLNRVYSTVQRALIYKIL